MRIDVMGVPFDNVTMEEALERAETLMAEPGAAYVVTPNAEIVYEALHDENLGAEALAALRVVVLLAVAQLRDAYGNALAAFPGRLSPSAARLTVPAMYSLHHC